MSELELKQQFQQALAWQKAGETQRAMQAYKNILTKEPTHPGVLYNLGTLCCETGDWQQAIAFHQAAIAAAPDWLAPKLNLALACIHVNQLDIAKTQLLDVIATEKDNFDAEHALAGLYMREQEYKKAQHHFENALHINLNDGDARYNLAMCYLEQGQWQNSKKLLKGLQQAATGDTLADIEYNLGTIEYLQNNITSAEQHWLKTLSLQPSYADAAYALAVFYREALNFKQAQKYIKKTSNLKPDDQAIKFLCDAWHEQSPNNMPQDYVERLFDDYAPSYEQHMQQQLDYKLPELFQSELSQLIEKNKLNKPWPQARVCDLGCGTGLLADAFKTSPKELIGVDLSSQMLHIAEHKKKYYGLVKAEGLAYLNYYSTKQQPLFDFIFACDVFMYVGDLKPWLEACIKCLNPKGILMFNIEAGQKQPFALGAKARYAHQPDYVIKLINDMGLVIYNNKLSSSRNDANKPVSTHIFTCARSL